MNRNDECCGGGSFFSFLLGAVVGAGLVALLSPTTGPENRRRLSALRDDLVDRSSDLREEASEKYHEARERIDETVEKGRQFVKQKKGVISSAIEAGRDAYTREKESGSADEA